MDKPIRNRVYIATCPGCGTIKMICSNAEGWEASTAQSVGEAIVKGLHVSSISPKKFKKKSSLLIPDACKEGCAHKYPKHCCAFCGGDIINKRVVKGGEFCGSFSLEVYHPDCAKAAGDEDEFSPENWGMWERPDSEEARADAAEQARLAQIATGQLELFSE